MYNLILESISSYSPSAQCIIALYSIHMHSLGDNPIGNDGLQALSEGIKNCKELQKL